MDFEEFCGSLSVDSPPWDISPLLAALWWDAKGNWTKAHEIAQEIESPDAAWIHAYLHRKEGDDGNAGYWYDRARGSRTRGCRSRQSGTRLPGHYSGDKSLANDSEAVHI